MNSWLLRLYDFLQTHRRWLWSIFVCIIIPLAILAISLRYNEDIMDFLPIADQDRESMTIYRQQQSANRIVFIVEADDPDLICDAIDSCAEHIHGLVTEVDLDAYLERLRYVHSQMPYFLTERDYAHLDSLFSPEAIRTALERDKRILSTPGTGFLSQTFQTDPLGLLPLTIGAKGQFGGVEAQSAFTSYNGYMMTNDQRMGFCFYDSPYGGTETRQNAALVDSLNSQLATLDIPNSSIRLLGAPIVAVGNARRIKTDTMLCIALSLVLIIALLLYAFPRKRDILLIMLSVAFGWLFGMAILRLYTPSVSAIVLGIGSVLIGIAVNYPLHLLVHQRYTSSVRQTLSEVLTPLVVGNITTVGAFLTLIPLRAQALRDLGIFAASMLIGTILFCVLVLPHLMSAEPTPVRELFSRLSKLNAKRSTINIGAIILLVLTLIAGMYIWLCPQPRFDSNLSHINYMTSQQRADFAYFDSLTFNSKQATSIKTQKYLAPSAREELTHRAHMWQTYWQTHSADSVVMLIQSEAESAGFRSDVFDPFCQLLTDWQPMDSVSTETLCELWPGSFDTETLNAHLTQGLSDNFDYIGLCCSLIVFLFLWLSFRNIWLAIIAFVPMALSWVWILAIMQLCGLQFNIINIILATFIFGQGDDYTIFVVEGLLYEHRTGQPMLPQYRQSILLSALIMLVGIGILILAVHPAMHMLGAVTLIGMTTVVIMALTIPPLLFRGLVRYFPKSIAINNNNQ